jgi:hypothetical protein
VPVRQPASAHLNVMAPRELGCEEYSGARRRVRASCPGAGKRVF